MLHIISIFQLLSFNKNIKSKYPLYSQRVGLVL
nr:MAG TPA: hypothetical protein [Caudoviricetes sp.]